MQHFSPIYLVIIVVVTLSAISEAKRGCALYGHSCYGGHGKRSSDIEVVPIENGSIASESKENLFPSPSNNNNINNNNNLNGFNQRDNQYQNHFNYALYNLMRQWMNEARKASDNQRATETIYKNNYV